ncbi:copper resistance protein B [Lysobacter ciconiae]|uniref:Copper resistance protein B n=1 Tax=Novilysobacter ciconiae TaxID=2781022 RepID=A0A7S6UEB1_9GAMM|nr:copper resistance protein B [Lysobacter ciconiae]QOW18691.1 copper resistance protein B [Lysobacter ciconiae]
MSRVNIPAGLALALGLALHGTAGAQHHHGHDASTPAPVAQNDANQPAQPAKKAKKKSAPVDHSGHGTPKSASPEKGTDHAATGHDAMDHGSMDHAAIDDGAMDHSTMGHGAQAANSEPITPIPAVTDIDRAAAFPVLHRPMEHAPEINSYVVFNRLEAWDADPGTGQAWEGEAWIGSDLNRLWLRSEVERSGGRTDAAELEVFYGRSVSTWWDVLAGIKHDFQPGDSQTWAAFGVQGLAPMKFDVSATAYVGDSGQTAANLEAEYELLLTNRLILQPLVEITAFGKDDPQRGVGSGLSSVEAGARLRYEINRRFAPYVGVAHERVFGNTADLRRADGEDTRDTRLVAGVRIWF